MVFLFLLSYSPDMTLFFICFTPMLVKHHPRRQAPGFIYIYSLYHNNTIQNENPGESLNKSLHKCRLTLVQALVQTLSLPERCRLSDLFYTNSHYFIKNCHQAVVVSYQPSLMAEALSFFDHASVYCGAVRILANMSPSTASR